MQNNISDLSLLFSFLSFKQILKYLIYFVLPPPPQHRYRYKNRFVARYLVIICDKPTSTDTKDTITMEE